MSPAAADVLDGIFDAVLEDGGDVPGAGPLNWLGFLPVVEVESVDISTVATTRAWPAILAAPAFDVRGSTLVLDTLEVICEDQVRSDVRPGFALEMVDALMLDGVDTGFASVDVSIGSVSPYVIGVGDCYSGLNAEILVAVRWILTLGPVIRCPVEAIAGRVLFAHG